MTSRMAALSAADTSGCCAQAAVAVARPMIKPRSAGKRKAMLLLQRNWPPPARYRDPLRARVAEAAEVHAVGQCREVGALAGEKAVLAADLGVEVADQAVDLLHRARGLAFDGPQVAVVLVDGAADREGRAHVLEQVARDRRLGRHLAGQRIQLAHTKRGGVELGLRGVPLAHPLRVARARAGLQARGDAV